MKAGLAREKGVGIIGLFRMFTEPDEEEVELVDMKQENEETLKQLLTPSEYLKNLEKEHGIEPKNLKVAEGTKTPKIKGATFSGKGKRQQVIEQSRENDEQSKDDNQQSLEL